MIKMVKKNVVQCVPSISSYCRENNFLRYHLIGNEEKYVLQTTES